MRSALEGLLRNDEISIVFQPIVDLATGAVAGHEALTRPDHSSIFPHAGALYEAAERLNMYEDLERIARSKALATFAGSGASTLLFLNNSAPVFTGADFVETILVEASHAAGLPPQRIVLEITERTAQWLMADLGERSRSFQSRGFSVALDDVGAGISGLNQIMALRPNWMKLDLELISGIDIDPLKQNLIRFFVHFAKLSNMKLVAEGIEQDQELETLIELGVSHGQGFYLGRPAALEAEIAPAVRDRIRQIRRQTEAHRLHDPGTVRISSLATPISTCDLMDTIGAVDERLAQLVHRRGMVVQDGRRYVGWLPRERLSDAALAGRNDHVAVRSLPIADAPIVGADVTLGDALEIVAARAESDQTMPLVVQDGERIRGIVTLRELLLAAADTHRRAPSHIAPLTGLPSRVQADRWIASRIKAGDPCDIVFIDFRDFDAYNVAHGFEKGDEMLVRLVGLIRHILVDVDQGASFFAHLGEDRFMLAFPTDARWRLVALTDAFMLARKAFFSASEVAGGTFNCEDPSGHRHAYPLTDLRVIYLPSALLNVFEPSALHFVASRLRLRGPDADGDDVLITESRESGAREKRESA